MKINLVMIVVIIIALLSVACTGKPTKLNETVSQTEKDLTVTETSSDTVKEETKESKSTAPSVNFIVTDLLWKTTKDMGDGLICFQDPNTELWGYSDYNGNVVHEAKYMSATGFSNGYAIVRSENTNNNQFIDTSGNIINTLEFSADIIKPFINNDDYAYVYQDGEYYKLDKLGGRTKIDSNFYVDDAHNVYQLKDPNMQGDIFGTVFNGYFGEVLIYDRTEKYGLLESFRGLERFDEMSIVNQQSEVVLEGTKIKAVFPEMTGIGLTDDYITISKVESKNTTTGLYDYQLNTIIPNGTYRYILPIDKEHIIVMTDDVKFGLVNSKNEFLIELSENPIYLLSDKEDYSNTLNGNGIYSFESQSDNTVNYYMYNNKIVNKTGLACILIAQEDSSTPNATYELYDLSKNKVVRQIPTLSRAHTAARTYLLPEVTLLIDPYEFYDLDGKLISTTVLSEEGWVLDEVAIDPATTIKFTRYTETKLIQITSN